ncbi:MAG TPA: hypothetical protein VH370_11235, partial [Humisphaera sp.]|nr:hypothetical protein [Humisphaera sp.]
MGAARAGGGISIVATPDDAVAGTAPVQWAISELARSLEGRGISVFRCESVSQAKAGDVCVVAAGAASDAAVSAFKGWRGETPSSAEALGILPTVVDKRRVILACGYDVRGLVYALLELADRVQNTAEPVAALSTSAAIVEGPVNSVRGINRLFTSDVEDKPWYNDREMWPQYLTLLASQRFNRFSLAFGIGYDFIRQVTDAYFLFAYPFLL